MADLDEWQPVLEKEPKRAQTRVADWHVPDDEERHPRFSPPHDYGVTEQPHRRRMLPWYRRLPANLRLMLEEEQAAGRGFLLMPVGLGLGAIWWFSRPVDLPSLPIVLAFGATTLAYFVCRHRHRGMAALFCTLALLLGGMVLADAETRRRDTVILDSPVTTVLRGRVVSAEPNADGNQRYVIALAGTRDPQLKRRPSRVAVLSRSAHRPFAAGDWLEGRARLSPPSGPALPGLNDFGFAAYFSDIGAIGYFYQAPTAINAAREQGAAGEEGILERLDRATLSLRSDISERIRQHVPGDAGAFAVAIVTGERRGLSAEANEDLRLSGLAHIISISGLHMALAGGLFFVGVRRLLCLVPGLADAWPVKKIAAAGAIATTTGYFCISGYDVTAQRAYLMMVIMLSAAFFDRPVLSLRNAAMAALLVILVAPSQVMGPSLQMSFAATFALIAGFDLWRQRPRFGAILPDHWSLAWLKPLAKAIGGVLITSAIGGVSTALFSAAHFHRLGLNGMEANLMAAPIMSMVVMPSALIGVLLMPFGLEEWPIRLMGLGLDAVLAIAAEVASWGGAIRFDRFVWWFLPVAALGLVLLTLLKTRLRLLGAAMMAVACLHAALRTPSPAADVLVSEDGQLIGLVRSQRETTDRAVADAPPDLATSRRTPPGFLFNQWSAAIAIGRTLPPVLLEKSTTTPNKTASDPWPGRNQAARSGTNQDPDHRPDARADTRSQATSRVDTPSTGDATERPAVTTRRPRPTIAPAEAMAAITVALTAARKSPDQFHCRSGGFCLARLSSGWTVVQVLNRDYTAAACALGDLIVNTQPRKRAACRDGTPTPERRSKSLDDTAERPWSMKADEQADSERPAPIVIDGDTLRHRGAAEIFLDDPYLRQAEILQAFNGLNRPWSRHRYYDWRSDRYVLPQASVTADMATHGTIPGTDPTTRPPAAAKNDRLAIDPPALPPTETASWDLLSGGIGLSDSDE